jgi:hypothetical protein
MGKRFHRRWKDFAVLNGHHFSSSKQPMGIIGISPHLMIATLQVTSNHWIFIFHCRHSFGYIKAINTKGQLQQVHHPM